MCLATWKEGSTRYLVGKIQEGNRRSTSNDEDQYRCFIYQRSMENGKTVYNVAQSGDATCTGLDATAFEGSRTMKLTTGNCHIFYSEQFHSIKNELINESNGKHIYFS